MGRAAKLEWVDGVMSELLSRFPRTRPRPPTTIFRWRRCTGRSPSTTRDDEPLPIGDARQFDGDLRRVFVRAADAPSGERAEEFLRQHEGELVTRIAYWTSEGAPMVRSLLRALRGRAAALGLRVAGLEAATLIELTAFGTAVMMHWRYARTFYASRIEVSS